MGFAGYVTVCVQLYCRWFTVLRLVVAVLHYMFRPTWSSSGVENIFTSIFLKESEQQEKASMQTHTQESEN
jgi:hypothetical protein